MLRPILAFDISTASNIQSAKFEAWKPHRSYVLKSKKIIDLYFLSFLYYTSFSSIMLINEDKTKDQNKLLV